MTTATTALLSPEELAAHVDTCHQVFQIWSGDGELIIAKENEHAVQQVNLARGRHPLGFYLQDLRCFQC